jgi:replicative DNA helicase
MSTEDQKTPQKNYTPSDTSRDGDEWSNIQSLIDTLTKQRDKIAQAKRAHDDGEEVQALKILQSAKDAVFKAFPAAPVISESANLDQSVRDLIAGYWDQVLKRKQTATTGISGLDDALSGGIEPQRLVVMLGAPNTGKTTFVHQMADHIACSGRPVLYVTSEDTPSALFAKTLARIGGIKYTAVLKGWETERININKALAEQQDGLSTDRLRYLDASNGITLDMIREKAQAHFAQYTAEHGGGSGVIIVDYLQRIARAVKSMSGMSQETREIVTMVAERLRAMACEMDCGVVAIASQNRSGYTRSGDQGALASAKESGDIEYTCDVLMALNEDKNRTASASWLSPITLYIDKNRQGPKGVAIPLDFYADRQQFTPVNRDNVQHELPATNNGKRGKGRQ